MSVADRSSSGGLPDSSLSPTDAPASAAGSTATHNDAHMEMDNSSSSDGGTAATGGASASAGAGVTAAARPRGASMSASKRAHPLLPSAIIAPSAGLHVSLSPRSEAKRMRTGEHTPGGSLLTTAQWAADVPMSPATSLVQQAFGRLAPSTPTAAPAAAAAGQTIAAATASKPSYIPPSPSRDHAAALPPAHPISPLANGARAGLLTTAAFSSTSTASALMSSPTRSNPSSATSSPSLTSLTGSNGSNGSAVSATTADAISPAPLSPSSAAHLHAFTQAHASHGVVLPQAHHFPAADSLSTPRRATQPVAAGGRPTPPDLDESAPVQQGEESEDEGMAGGGSSKKKSDNRQGASCHQCKTTKDEQHLLFCTTKAGGARKRRCRKKYCDSCLSRTYGVHLATLLSSPSMLASWQCPSCSGKCTCAGCTRKGGHGGGRSSAAAAPITPIDSAPAPTKAKSKQQQHPPKQSREQPPEPKVTDWVGAMGAHMLPAAGFISSRAASAPGAAFADSLHLTRGLDAARAPIPALAGVAPVVASSDANPQLISSPAHMDAIASLLLELSTAAATSSSVAESSGPSSASVMATESSAKPISPPSDAPSTTLLHAGMSPAKLAAAQAVDSARLAALRNGRPMGATLPLSPFTYGATSSLSVAAVPPAVSTSYSGSRFTASPVSLLQSSTNGPFGMRSAAHQPLHQPLQPPPQHSAYTRYATALTKLTSAPQLGQRATSESTLLLNRHATLPVQTQPF